MELEKQNILFIGRATQQAGTENVILQLCEIFKPQVNKIVVCSADGINKSKLDELGIKLYVIPDIEKKDPFTFFRIIKKLLYIIKKEQITVIHTHHRMAAFYVSLLKLYKNRYFINTSHNTFKNKYELTRFSYKNAHLIACGEKVKENLEKYYHLKNVTVIHNAIKAYKGEIRTEESLYNLKNQGYFLIGNVGRFTKQKGMEYFIKSIPSVINKYPNCRFIIIGDGELRNSLVQLANQLKVNDYILWLGYRDNIQNLMAQLDLIVLSSLWEGLPLTPIEAFSVSKPVVATSVDGTVEIVKNGENGFLVKPADVDDLFKCICKAIESDINVLGRNAYKTYKEEFSFDVFANRLIHYYGEL